MTENSKKPETRLTEDLRELASLVKEWAEVGLERSKVEIEYRINQMLLQFIAVVIGIFVLFFVLLTLALGLGLWLGHPFWGFLVVSAVLVVSVLILKWARPTLWSFSGSSRDPQNNVKTGVAAQKTKSESDSIPAHAKEDRHD